MTVRNVAVPLPNLTDAQMENFWNMVEVNQPSGCWEWTGCKWKGYGKFNVNGTPRKAHRISYTLLIGETLMDLDHLCRNRGCVNPDHLRTVTQQENFLAGYSHFLTVKRSGKCANGHALTLENTIQRSNGTRRCRICKIEYDRRYHQSRKKSHG